MSRVPTIATLSPLTVADLRRILTEVNGSLVSQYQAQFGNIGVEIKFTSAALDEVCLKAVERGGGARGLRGIMVCFALVLLCYLQLIALFQEKALLDCMFEVP